MDSSRSFKILSLDGSDKYRRLLQNNEDTHNLKSGFVVLQPGENIGEHSTENKEEIIIFLEGEADIFIEGELKGSISAPEAIYIPPETKHDVTNTGQSCLKYVYTVTFLEQHIGNAGMAKQK